MERLCGPDSLPVVCRRFSNGVEVLKCVSGFIKEVSDVEQSYSNSIQKLVKSPLYALHSNFIMQLLGTAPHQEIGTVKHSWLELGNQLSSLATLHADKAKAYMTEVRQPLLDLAPKLEEARKEIRNRSRQLLSQLEAAAGKHQRMKTRYQQTADETEKYWQKVQTGRAETLLVAHQKAYIKHEEKFATLKAELRYHETEYESAHRKHVEARESFDKDVKELYTDIHDKETERVNTIKRALREFAKALSNTVPVYLEAMKTIVISLDEIDSNSDIESFVGRHGDLTQHPDVPAFEKHPTAIRVLQDDGPPARSLANGKKATPIHGQATPIDSETHPERVDGDGAPHPPSTEQAKSWSGGVKPGSGKPPAIKPVKPAKLDKPVKPPPKAAKPVKKPAPVSQVVAGTPSAESKGTTKETASNTSSEGTSSVGEASQERPRMPSASSSKPPLATKRVSPMEDHARHTGAACQTVGATARHSAKQQESDDEERAILQALQDKANENDYYKLLRVSPTASAEELAGARRERTRQLHPDHFANDDKLRELAQEELVRVNQAYQDVLRGDESRDLYNQLCAFRRKYPLILNQVPRGLSNAQDRLSDLRKQLKRSRCPQALVEELDAALHLIQTRIVKLEGS